MRKTIEKRNDKLCREFLCFFGPPLYSPCRQIPPRQGGRQRSHFWMFKISSGHHLLAGIMNWRCRLGRETDRMSWRTWRNHLTNETSILSSHSFQIDSKKIPQISWLKLYLVRQKSRERKWSNYSSFIVIKITKKENSKNVIFWRLSIEAFLFSWYLVKWVFPSSILCFSY